MLEVEAFDILSEIQLGVIKRKAFQPGFADVSIIFEQPEGRSVIVGSSLLVDPKYLRWFRILVV